MLTLATLFTAALTTFMVSAMLRHWAGHTSADRVPLPQRITTMSLEW